MNYVRFPDVDRDWNVCDVTFIPEEGYEPFFNIPTIHMIRSSRDEILAFLKSKGIVADLDEYSGDIHVLTRR